MAAAKNVLNAQDVSRRVRQLAELPFKMEKTLEQADDIQEIAESFHGRDHALFMGRGVSYPIALEGALKLKEISYIHAEGYPAGEMKHGPIALIDQRTPVLAVIPSDALHIKTLSNIDEVLARSGSIVAVATSGDTVIGKRTRHVFFVPECDGLLNPMLTVLPLQLYAYYSAIARGRDVDKPRNLAKSVTVE